MPRANAMIALSGQPLDVISPYISLQQNRRANRLADLQERQIAMAEQEVAREQERQARVQNVLAQLGAPDMPEQQRQAATLKLYGEDPRVAAGVSAEIARSQELQRQRQIEDARRRFLEADYVIRNPQYAMDIFRGSPDAYAQFTQQLGREPTQEDVIRRAHQTRAHYGPLAGIELPENRADLPASIQEWLVYNGMTPEQQQRYLQMKRATDRIVEVAGVPTLVQTGVTPTTRPLSTLEQELKAIERKEGEKTRATEGAKADLQAIENLPRVQQQAQEMLTLLDQLENHPGLSGAVGARMGLEYVPGTDAADFVALHDQVAGRLFMQAFEGLKGGGQITEKEGEKATAAISRLQNRWQSEASYRSAIQELRSIVERGLERAQQRAARAAQNFGRYTGAPNDQAGAGSPAPPAAASPSAPTQTPTPVRVGTKEQYDALPSGAVFVAPDGSVRVKP